MNPRIEKTIRLTRNKLKRTIRRIKAKINHEPPIPKVVLDVHDCEVGISSKFVGIKEKSNGSS